MPSEALGTRRVGSADLPEQTEQDRLVEGHPEHGPHHGLHPATVRLVFDYDIDPDRSTAEWESFDPDAVFVDVERADR